MKNLFILLIFSLIVSCGDSNVSLEQKHTNKDKDVEKWFKKALDSDDDDYKINCLSKVLSIDPDHVSAYNNRGLAYQHMGRYEDAINDYNTGLSLDPNNFMLYGNRGATYNLMGRYVEAINDFDQALSINPDGPKIYLNRGNSKYYLNRFNEAISDYKRAMSRDHNALYSNIALAYEGLGLNEEASSYHYLAVSDNPYDVDALINRGNYFLREGNSNSAIADYTKGIELDPKCSSCYFNRALAYEKSGSLVLSCLDFKQACIIGDDNACNAFDTECDKY